MKFNSISFISNMHQDYVHRIGRTGRCQQTGTAYTLFTNNNSAKANDLINVLREANQIINPRLLELSKGSYGRSKLMCNRLENEFSIIFFLIHRRKL